MSIFRIRYQADESIAEKKHAEEEKGGMNGRRVKPWSHCTDRAKLLRDCVIAGGMIAIVARVMIKSPRGIFRK